MILFGLVASLDPDLRINKAESEIKYARPRAIKSSAGESVGCAMFDDPDDDGDGVECRLVETRTDDEGQQIYPPRSAPGKEIAVNIKVKRGLQFVFAETGGSFTHVDDNHETSMEPGNEYQVHREPQLLEEASIDQGESTNRLSLSTAADVHDQIPPLRNDWVFRWKYSWIQGYTILFVRATDFTKKKFVRVGFQCRDKEWFVQEQVKLVEIF